MRARGKGKSPNQMGMTLLCAKGGRPLWVVHQVQNAGSGWM